MFRLLRTHPKTKTNQKIKAKMVAEVAYNQVGVVQEVVVA
jgi:hypothetical protein